MLPLDLSSNEEENHLDLSSEDDVDGAVSIKAWGKRKSAYYNEESDGEREGLEQELEEKEAIDMQHQLAALLAEGDFEADFSDNEEPSKTDVSCCVYVKVYVAHWFCSVGDCRPNFVEC